MEHASLLRIALLGGFLVSVVISRASVVYLFLLKARKFGETENFVFVNLIEQEPDTCDKCHLDYARQDKI
jgi:hypothetical protein